MKLLTTPITIEDIKPLADAGADGLIFGTAFFSLRAAAVFPEAMLKELAERCHACHVKMLVLVNRLFIDQELPKVREHLAFLKAIHADGIYFSDEALLLMAEELGIKHLLIYQPDTLLTNHQDVDYYLNEGLQSVVLAKEITLQEMLMIAANSDASRMEVIGHGHLVMMHSRRRLLSSYMEFLHRSDCLCDKYNLTIEEETRKDAMPIFEDNHGTHIFSSFVQQSFDETDALIHAGIGAMRIDGIFHNGAQIRDIVSLYDRLRNHEIDPASAKKLYESSFPEEKGSSGFYYQATSTSKQVSYE